MNTNLIKEQTQLIKNKIDEIDDSYFIRDIKMIDISLLGVYYLICGIISAIIINKIFQEIEQSRGDNKEESNSYKAFRIILRTALIMISAYLMRNIVREIPFLLDGYFGYEHLRLKEMNGGVIIAFSIIALQPEYRKDIQSLASTIKENLLGFL